MKASSIIVLTMFCLFGCTPQQSERLSVIPLASSLENDKEIDEVPFRLTETATVNLELTDSVILATGIFISADTSIIALSNLTGVYFFSAKDGKYLSGVKKQGNGPGEYTAVHDALYDPVAHSVTILDLNLQKVLQYDMQGKCLSEHNSRGISALEYLPAQGGSILSINGQTGSHIHGLGLWSSRFEPKDSVAYPLPPGKPVAYDLMVRTDFSRSGEDVCLYKEDTLFRANRSKLVPILAVDKGRLSIPDEIMLNLDRRDERSSYIWSDYCLLSGDFLFLRYIYRDRYYSDIWDTSTCQLRFRRVSDSNWTGFPVKTGSTELSVWPKWAGTDALYTLLKEEDMLRLGVDPDTYNFVLLKMKWEK
jgi:hypothetical protein